MPYANPNATVAGLSFTPHLGKSRNPAKTRFHAVNVPLAMYEKILHREGRMNIRLFELPNEMSRVEAAVFVRDQLEGDLTPAEMKELARVIGEYGKIRRYHGFTNTQKVRQHQARLAA